MPRRRPSYHERRGKPRLSSQSQNAIVRQRFNRNVPDHKKSERAKIKPFANNDSVTANTKEDAEADELKLQKKMWKNIDVSEDNPIDAPLVTSSFGTRFPEHREQYIRNISKQMATFLHKYGVHIEITYGVCSMEVRTTKKMWDPYSIIKARDMIRLISRYVPFEAAAKVMKDETFSEIIEIGKTDVARNQVRFIKRRSRLIGPNVECTRCHSLIHSFH